MSATVAPPRAGTRGVTAGGVLRSEWLKLVTVRATFWTTLVSLVLALGLATLLGAFFRPDGPGGGSLALIGATLSVTFVSLVVGVLGVLSIGGEYTTQQIRSSYAAVPRRLPVLLGKGTVVGAWSLVLGLIAMFGSYGIMALFLGGKGVTVPFDGPVVGALIGGGAYLAVVAVFSVGLGATVRASAAGISILTAVVFVLPIVLSILAGALNAEWARTMSDYTLSAAGGGLSAGPGNTGGVALWALWLTLAGWLAAAWIPALLLTRVRDV